MLHKFSSFAACKANARHLDCDSINCVYCKKKKLYSFRIWGMTNNYSPSHSYNYSVRHWQRLIDYLPHCLHSGLMIQLPHRYWSADLFPCSLSSQYSYLFIILMKSPYSEGAGNTYDHIICMYHLSSLLTEMCQCCYCRDHWILKN